MVKVKRIGGWTNRQIDLGGLTAPGLTRRPHMGPLNTLSPVPLSQYPGDEPYRLHDIGYGKLSNPYFNFNKYDEQLLRSKGNEWPDYLAKGVFYGKKVLDVFNTPSLYKGGYMSPLKEVNAKSNPPIYDAKKVPFREFTNYPSDKGNWRVDEDPNKKRWSRKPKAYVVPSAGSGDLYPGKVPPGHRPGLGPGGTRARNASKFHSEVRYERG